MLIADTTAGDYAILALIAALIVTLIAALVYAWWLPISIARKRKHPQVEAITLCTVFAIVFWPLWIAAMIWAHTVPERH